MPHSFGLVLHRSKELRKLLPGTWRGSGRDWSAVFDDHPTQQTCVAQGLFYGESKHRAVAYTFQCTLHFNAPRISKNAYSPVGIPLIRGASGTGRWTQPRRRRKKAWGEGPLRLKEISRYRDTLGQIRAADNTAGRSATRNLEKCRPILICGIWWPPHPTGMCGTRTFYGVSERWAIAHTRRRGKKLWGKAPWDWRKSPDTETHSARSVPQITWPAEALPGNWRGSDRDWSVVFVDRPTQRACVAQGLFYGGSGRRAVAHTRPAFAKNAYGPVGIPLIRGVSGAGRLTQPSRRR